MAECVARRCSVSVPASCTLREPDPTADFEVRELSHADVAERYHVYCTRGDASTPADTFAEDWGDTRFAPIVTEDGTPVRTYYVASTPEAAYMESVLHDVPYLPRLGLTRAPLIDSLACHGQTRRWSQAAYLQRCAAQAVGYGSKRDDSARCLMLFKQRLPDLPIEILGEEPLAVGPRRADFLALVRSLKLNEA
jgi:hypothetical protein